MASRTYETSFRTVVLHYDETKTETAYEKEVVKKYLSFIRKMAKMKEQVKAVTNNCYKEQLLEEEITGAMEDLEEQLQPVSEQVKRIVKTKVIATGEFFPLREKFNSLFKSYLKLHSEKLNESNEVIAENNKAMKKLYTWFEEKAYEMFKEFSDFQRDLYSKDGNHSLDVVKFYDEIDSMKADWQQAGKEWDALCKLRDTTIDKSDACVLQMKALTKTVATLQSDIDGMSESWTALNN